MSLFINVLDVVLAIKSLVYNYICNHSNILSDLSFTYLAYTYFHFKLWTKCLSFHITEQMFKTFFFWQIGCHSYKVLPSAYQKFQVIEKEYLVTYFCFQTQIHSFEFQKFELIAQRHWFFCYNLSSFYSEN